VTDPRRPDRVPNSSPVPRWVGCSMMAIGFGWVVLFCAANGWRPFLGPTPITKAAIRVNNPPPTEPLGAVIGGVAAPSW